MPFSPTTKVDKKKPVVRAVAKPKKPKPWHPWQAPAKAISDEGPSPNSATALIIRPLSAVAGDDWVKPLGAAVLSLFVFGLAFAMYRVPERT